MEKKFLIYLGGILIFVIFVIWLISPFFQKKTYKTFEVKRGTIEMKVSGKCQVKPSPPYFAFFNQEGTIQKIYFKEGEKVKTGEVLAELENKNLKSELGELMLRASRERLEMEKIGEKQPQEQLKIIQEMITQFEKELSSLPQNAKASFNNIFSLLTDIQFKIQIIARKYFNDSSQESLAFLQTKTSFDKKIEEFAKLKDEPITLNNLEEKTKKAQQIINSLQSASIFLFQSCEALKEKKAISDSDLEGLKSSMKNLNKAQIEIFIIENTKLSYDFTLKEYEKMKNQLLTESGKKKPEEYEKEIAEIESKISELNSKIENTLLKTPIDGQIKSILKKEGEFVKKGETIFEILPLIEHELEGEIELEKIQGFKVGQEVEISFNGEKEIIMGTLKYISEKSIKRGKKEYFLVKIQPRIPIKEALKNKDCNFTIIGEKKEGILLVPKEAIFSKKGKYFVKVLQGNVKKDREVEIGFFDSGMVEVTKGLKEKEVIIIP